MPHVAHMLLLNFTDCRKSIFLAYVGLGKGIFFCKMLFFQMMIFYNPPPNWNCEKNIKLISFKKIKSHFMKNRTPRPWGTWISTSLTHSLKIYTWWPNLIFTSYDIRKSFPACAQELKNTHQKDLHLMTLCDIDLILTSHEV